HGEVRVARIVMLLVDEPGWRVDLGERAEETELLAVLEVPPAPPVPAAGPDVHVAHRHVPAAVALPPAHEGGTGVRIPHQLPRCMERTGDADFAIARQGHFGGLLHGGSLVLFAVLFALEVLEQGIEALVVPFPHLPV